MQTVIESTLLNYEILGSRNKDAILILHGWKRSLKDWGNIASNLSNKFKVILVDLPGMGNSSNPKTAFDTYDYANLINKFILKLNLSNLILLGHSFGGKTAIVIVSSNKNVKKLILVDPSGISQRSFLINLKIYLSKLVKIVLPKKINQKLINLLSSDDYKNAGILLESFKKIVKQDISKYAQKIKIPTLIIWGDKDKEVPVSSSKKLKNLISNSKIRIVWNTGHDPFIEKPNKFLEILEEFINE